MSAKRERDLTKYLYDGKKYAKRRLVLSILKMYVADHPDISFNDLKMVFPDILQSNSEIQFSTTRVVFSKVEKIKSGDGKRFFTKEEELIQIKDCKIAVSKEWNYQNIQNFIDVAVKLGYGISVAK